MAKSKYFNQFTKAAVVLAITAILTGDAFTRINAAEPAGPVQVQLRQVNGAYQLFVDHKPFYIKGAGLEFGNQEKLAEHGGNSFRTWRCDNGQESGKQVLDRALKNHLYVAMCLDISRERHGFNYNDPAAVAQQLEAMKAEVLKYKDHPALIIWVIGNELNLGAKNPKVWDAVNDISKMIHQVDPNHLTTTAIAGMSKNLVDEIKTRAADLDLLSIQMYGEIVKLPQIIKDCGWTGPYMVTEWGATGHWEVAKTDWGAPIENNSSVKADYYLTRYQTAIASDHTQCVGSYVFLWGQKQERTPTWYGMFLDTGEETATIDVLHYVWNGSWPAIRAPRLKEALLDGKSANQSIHLKTGGTYKAEVSIINENNLPTSYHWEVLNESTDLKWGGDFETRPKQVPGLIKEPGKQEIQLSAPAQPGAYRLYVYAYDGQGHAAHANIPFYVNQ